MTAVMSISRMQASDLNGLIDVSSNGNLQRGDRRPSPTYDTGFQPRANIQQRTTPEAELDAGSRGVRQSNGHYQGDRRGQNGFSGGSGLRYNGGRANGGGGGDFFTE